MPTYTATYTTYYTFDVPKDVVLIKEEDQVEGESHPGYWWVKWGTFYYIDKNGEQHEIEGDKSSDKWPDHMEEPEEDDEDEEDEEDEEAEEAKEIENPFEEDEKCCKCNAAFTYEDNLQKGYNLETGADRMCSKCCYDQETWADDDLALELNYGNCLNDGRHPNTNDDDWALFLEGFVEPIVYSEDRYRRLEKRLEERKKKAEEFCEEHEQVMWKDGMKCSGCLEEEDDEDEETEYVCCVCSNIHVPEAEINMTLGGMICDDCYNKPVEDEDDEDAIDYSKLNHIKTTPGGVEIYA